MTVVPTTASAAPVNVGDWTLKNPDGAMPHFSYDILKSHHGSEHYRSELYVRAKLRCHDRPLAMAGLQRDVAAQQLILPPKAPDLYANADRLWREVDDEAWNAVQHLLVGPTIWFPKIKSRQWAVRQAAAFAQAVLADGHGVAVHLIAHAPSRIGHKADFHVHLVCSARQLESDGFGEFARGLIDTGCQHQCKADWDAWWAAHPVP